MTAFGKSGKNHEGDVAFIESLAELLNSSELSELSVKREYGEHDRLTVSLSKHGKQVVVQSAAPAHAPMAHAAPAAAPQSPATPTATPGATSDDPANLPGAVTSPMVGTAYLSAEPGAAPFVTIGQQVSEGDTLLIVEAMKTMNHIPSPKSGTVKRILVDDGTPVEYGAPLMVVE
ncbi:MAG TPA: acetyl-CoA carboxylase biotin carboxyl carrier protein [Paracoccus sp. (in: a-proteobacteria)]|uniref:acetyl-CoA carboxylase biotin carboxyl carrier protein n=1 Tax=uncultured Paracoccus sp. TaxID=189685 RepID=UPI00261BA422|nr:acetyl-CoA carboxylase biotin carboxyl carrier protein [uncultured Paracoccus sp.]HMQ40001.1 acetyl-CoA carboxylase biotin carboxyl carrier protein [Paracoccus sp. (in: a-proteobacteria)]HMR36922.1 acetyl-CoA carboxylase biotin carboxyl carrier protein [Paracoccus sp. (in: a-proteobacteria)]